MEIVGFFVAALLCVYSVRRGFMGTALLFFVSMCAFGVWIWSGS